MTTEQRALALSLADRCLRVANDLFDSDDYDSAEAVRDSAITLGALHWELAELRTQIADLTLSLEASERRVENHTSLIKGYQTELAAAKAQVEALSIENDVLRTQADAFTSQQTPVAYLVERHAFCASPHGQDAEGHDWLEVTDEKDPNGFPVYWTPHPSLTRPAVLEGWRPIETAPKDGTHILGWNQEYGARETKMKFYGEGSIGYDEHKAGKGPIEIGWDWSEPKNNWGFSWNPTHWIPLLAAPQPD